jgi:uncharacterized protein YutE (UPF0331/DUF86 family)
VSGAPLDAEDADRARVLKRKALERLTDIRRHYRALEAAMAEFGEGFLADAFADAAASDEPAALNRVKAVERGLDQLFNYLAELGELGLELAGLKSGDQEANARSDLRQLRDAGVIEAALCEQLVRVAGIRNRMVHDYVGVTGVEVHEAVRLLAGALPRYVAAYQDWIKAGFLPRAAA